MSPLTVVPEVVLSPFDVSLPPIMMIPFHMLLPEITKSESAMMIPRPALGRAKPFVWTRITGQRLVSASNHAWSGKPCGGTSKSAGSWLALMMAFQSMLTSVSSTSIVFEVSSGGLPVGTKPPDWV